MNSTSSLAPVVVFCYRRPQHLQRTLASLQQCPEFSASPVIVYCDGPRCEEERGQVQDTRQVAKKMLGERVDYRFSETNNGLAESVIKGVTETVEKFGRVIVVEDDLSVSPSFLEYMNRALDRYENEDTVYQISGYQFDVPEFEFRDTAVFLPITVSWGWATWKRAWRQFDSQAEGWSRLLQDRKLRRRFNLNGVYDYSTMMVRQVSGRRDSWAIRWYWTVFNRGGLVVFPPRTLVSNTGFDGSGTHGRGILREFSKPIVRGYELTSAQLPVAKMEKNDFSLVRSAIWRANGRHIGAIVDRVRWVWSMFNMRRN